MVSLNVKGLNHPVKRKKIMDYLARTKGDVVLLQETKLSQGEADKVTARWLGESACSPAAGKKGGVMTLK